MGIKTLLEKIRLLVLGKVIIKEQGASYQDLRMLIERSISRMKIQPNCPYCGSEMMFRNSSIVGTAGPIRDDIGMKCPNCFHTAHFGVPISRQEYEEEIKLRGGQWLLRPTYRLDERSRTDVKERLKALGYLDFD